jgi:hypothetical protein
MSYLIPALASCASVLLAEVALRYRRYRITGLIDRRHRFASYVQAAAMDKDLNKVHKKVTREKAQR